ncbi:hypothetical protein [Pseudomonas svalbardensis]|uniref:hypothetical protein n=1 Tax=Pseudomonas svalbardensis TaxID=3042029 RepID=UPI0024B3C31C|nr:hypothetical protein [Pseudomonas sp. PMCC200367]
MDSNELTSTLLPYYEALNRLVENKTLIVPAGSKITLNSVALEAGKSEGSIKKSRPVYRALIEEIKVRARQQMEARAPGSFKVSEAKDKASKEKATADSFKEMYKAGLARELMLLMQLDKAEESLRKVSNVVPIRPRDGHQGD